jgi:TRAP-type C4-dicarboxylate transport system permease small subunit
MKALLGIVPKVTRYMEAIAVAALTFIICLTTLDVIMRAFGHPIIGTYEIVAMCGGIVIGFIAPITAWLRGHVYVDFVIKKFSPPIQNTVNVITRFVGITMFVIVGVNVVKVGNTFRNAGEVSNSLQLPLYPIAYAMAFSFFVLAVVLVTDIIKIHGGSYE